MTGAVRRGYVAVARAARRALPAPEQPLPPGLHRHLRSLLDVHDVDALVQLDLPWWTYRATAVVDAFLAGRQGRARAFEWGSGASTVWLARRCASVVSVEHDAGWADAVRARLPAGAAVDLRLVPATPAGRDAVRSGRRDSAGLDFRRYVEEVHRAGDVFDLMVVDGRARGACLTAALPHLREDGLLVVDNSRRARYRAAIDQSGLRVRRFRGAVPGLPYPDETALLDRRSGQDRAPGR